MPNLLSDEIPEIYHYTTATGLKGIVESQTLWATHYAYLNDAEEIRHFGERLRTVLQPDIEGVVIEFLKRASAKAQRFIDEQGGIAKVKEEEARTLVRIMYNVLLGNEENPPLAEPYITSFCTAANEREKKDGLLSQWRGYGSDGGYAIVFDTKRIEDLLKEESRNWEYNLLLGGDVMYTTAPDEKIREEFGDRLNAIRHSVKEFYEVIQTHGEQGREKAERVLGPIYPAILYCSCRYKDCGFEEEKEVRIVAIPQSPETRRAAEAEGRFVKPAKRVKHFVRSGLTVPYIDLFEDITVFSGKRLPITRIIVGPHVEKDKRRQAIKSLLEHNAIDAKVSASEIPYLGR